ncbi:putative tensin phosphatase, C2 domain, formin, FH2 domain, protein-tyrosine phosphatase [Helianthus annuus]|uniref:formin-like protein 14 isoform X1 n=1 Tax=Helianthus annuus TaxID=4232 RepID=UPI000B8FC1B3|nr:formin-like protein 14 isoform X1 [Helianthus annuus]XP_021969942.1 formin-like protein 14 isoform X1 [Helianthus annuus]KAJ0559962.1 putative tensin phosphatase, C2 domain, formin, FH2 domain, protein-tyrosine phosphatase [Helianthus annuus]KAJ0572949.1 putative tensin phosphatase, C2 domain, formin, FH2 domain, protein-tyrosine phosphatase [Helianthus annuus]KAJ0911180.1 putative tensin phosphatase, C2 domain, formin, FH2 domain, protein-tyrosine phosphatase [Helianthus annuus]
MPLLRRFFYRRPPDGLLELADRIYVFDSCFSTEVLPVGLYHLYLHEISNELHEEFPESSFLAFNFREGENRSQFSEILCKYDITVIDYPKQYEGCPLLPLSLVHHFLHLCESWLTLETNQNVILLHCERGGWSVLAFLLASLLVYKKLHTGERKTLEIVCREAPRGLYHLLSPLNPYPSQLRYLQYISRRNLSEEWPPPSRALSLDCLILRAIPNFDNRNGCRPVIRIYGRNLLSKDGLLTQMIYSTPRSGRNLRHYHQKQNDVIKIDIQCLVEGDVVLECVHLDVDCEREVMMFRVMFNTAFIRSNILMLNHDNLDTLWDSKARFPKNFRAEVLFGDVENISTPKTPITILTGEEKGGLPIEAFNKVQELFSGIEWGNGGDDTALWLVKQLSQLNDAKELSILRNRSTPSSPFDSSEDENNTPSVADSLEYLESERSNETPTPTIDSSVSSPNQVSVEDVSTGSQPPLVTPTMDSFRDASPVAASPSPPPPSPSPSFFISSGGGSPQSHSLITPSNVPLLPPPPPFVRVSVDKSSSKSPPPLGSTSKGTPEPQPTISSGATAKANTTPGPPPLPPPPPPGAPHQGTISSTIKPHGPPPPGAPPPPPPPGCNAPGAPPPPPPPGCGGGGPPPPPGPTGSNGLQQPAGRLRLSGSLNSGKGTGGEGKKMSLKPLHWVKVTRAMQGSLWADTQKQEDRPRAPEIDILELESLFSAASVSDNSKGGARRGAKINKPEKVQLVDLRRAYNCEIMLTKIKIPLPNMLNAILALDTSALDIDQIESLIKFCPTKEEMQTLKNYTGNKEMLGKCELFFMELMTVPRVESKLRVFAFTITFTSQVSDLRRNLSAINDATKEIKESAKLRQIMQTILTLGNALNQGTARGSAIGFKLDSLLKLSDTRARNNKMTLMHYLCKLLAEKMPHLLDFDKDLGHLEAASKIQLKTLAEEMQAVSKGLEKVEQELTASENDGAISAGFQKALKGFLDTAEAEVRALISLYTEVGRNADSLSQYFGEDPVRCPFEQVTQILAVFAKMFKKARDDNKQQADAEKKRLEKEALKEQSSANKTSRKGGVDSQKDRKT